MKMRGREYKIREKVQGGNEMKRRKMMTMRALIIKDHQQYRDSICPT